MLGWWLRVFDVSDGWRANFSVMDLSLTVFKYEKEQNSLHISEEGISLHCKDDSFFTTVYICRKHYAWLLYIYVLSSKIHVDMHLYHWPIKAAHVVYTDVNKLQLKATLTFLFNKTYRVKPQQKQVRFRGRQKRIFDVLLSFNILYLYHDVVIPLPDLPFYYWQSMFWYGPVWWLCRSLIDDPWWIRWTVWSYRCLSPI